MSKSGTNLKTRTVGTITAIVLVTIVIFLAVGAGYFLYNPGKLSLSSPFGVLNIIRGNVQVLKKDALTWKRAENGTALEPGSRVKTSSGALAEIKFAAGTTSKLESGTDLIIDKIQSGETSQAYAVILKQQAGKTWNQVDKGGGKASFQIKTASAEITVHGTVFGTEVDSQGKTIVQTSEGSVGVNAGGAAVQVPAGMMTEVPSGEKPSPPIAMPQPSDELVITINQPAFSLLKDPGGSSAGYRNNGEKVNQIPGASVSGDGQSGQTIYIRDAQAGDYTLLLHGIASGAADITVQGLVGGESAFLHVESCNLTAAKDTLLKLHYNVIDGLLQRADEPSQGIASTGLVAAVATTTQPAPAAKTTSVKPAPASSTKPPATVANKNNAAPDKGLSWLGGDKNTQLGRLVSIACFVFLVAVVFVLMRRQG
jgi:hypothetical protein